MLPQNKVQKEWDNTITQCTQEIYAILDVIGVEKTIDILRECIVLESVYTNNPIYTIQNSAILMARTSKAMKKIARDARKQREVKNEKWSKDDDKVLHRLLTKEVKSEKPNSGREDKEDQIHRDHTDV